MESVLVRLSSFDHCACGGWLTWGWRNNTPNPQGASRPRPKLAGQPAAPQNQKNPRSQAPRDNQVPNQRRVGGRTNPLAHLQPWCEMKWDTMGRGGRRGGSPSLVLLLLFYHLPMLLQMKGFLALWKVTMATPAWASSLWHFPNRLVPFFFFFLLRSLNSTVERWVFLPSVMVWFTLLLRDTLENMQCFFLPKVFFFFFAFLLQTQRASSKNHLR